MVFLKCYFQHRSAVLGVDFTWLGRKCTCVTAAFSSCRPMNSTPGAPYLSQKLRMLKENSGFVYVYIYSSVVSNDRMWINWQLFASSFIFYCQIFKNLPQWIMKEGTMLINPSASLYQPAPQLFHWVHNCAKTIVTLNTVCAVWDSIE